MTDQALESEHVAFCVDTNVLVEFQDLGSLPWSELTPNASNIRIIVPTKVAEEMDAHKKKTGRLRRRGLEFSALAREIEDSANGEHIVRRANPTVSVEFGPVFRRSQLDGDLYDLDDADGRVVAEVAAIRNSEVPGAVLLSDDSKPIRLAKTTGVPQIRPLAGWRRAEGPDERDIEISELRREIGARPNLTIAFPDATDDRNQHIIERAPETTDQRCIAAFRRIAPLADPRVSREHSINKYGIQDSSPFGLGLRGAFGSGLSEYDLSTYDKEFDRYAALLDKVANNLPRMFQVRGIVLPIALDIGNDGERAAERVHVEAALSGTGFCFLPPDIVADDIRRYLRSPRPPKPYNPLANLSHQALEPLAPRRADIFHDQDTANAEGGDTYVSWRCEELRQGAHYELPVLVAAEETARAGALTVSVTSAVLATKVSLIAPLALAPASDYPASASYLLRRLGFLPKRFRKLLRPELETIAKEAE